MTTPFSVADRPGFSILTRALVVASGVYSIAAFLYVTCSRLAYPFALEWLEGTSLVHVQRILDGKLLYVQPGLAFVPLSYPPLYYYVSAFLARFMEPGFLPLRLVSLLSTLGCFGLIYAIIRHQTRSALSALVGAGLFAASFRIGGAWFDIARVDMLAVFLMLASMRMALSRKWAWSAAAGLAIAAACLTKQTFMIILVVMVLHAFLTRQAKNAGAFAGAAVASYSLAILALDRLHAGWFRFFVFELPGRHDLLREMAFASRSLWVDKLLLALPIAAAFSSAHFALAALPAKTRGMLDFAGSDAGRLLAVLVAALALGWSGLANPGGYDNVLIPLLAMLAVSAGLGFHSLTSSRSGGRQLAVGALVLLQFAILRYPIAAQIPTESDLAAGNRLVALLRDHPGDVFVPYHPELTLFAGKPVLANYIAMYELEGGQGGGDAVAWRRVRNELVAAFQKNRFDVVILDKQQFWGSPDRYYAATVLPDLDDDFYPVTGWRTRPTTAFAISP